MENRYLFRAKRIDNGEWVEGYLSYPSCTEKGNESYYFYAKDSLDFFSRCVVDASTVCQCTGRNDKNGNLIWENDIIECKDGKHNFQTQIEWDAYCAGFIFQDTETSVVGLDAITANGLYSESKVVSNIFDNQELSEVRL